MLQFEFPFEIRKIRNFIAKLLSQNEKVFKIFCFQGCFVEIQQKLWVELHGFARKGTFNGFILKS